MKQSPAALRAFTASCTGVLSLPVSFHSEKTPLYPNRPTRTRRPPGERPTKFNWRGLLPIELAPDPQLSPTSPLAIGKNRLLPSAASCTPVISLSQKSEPIAERKVVTSLSTVARSEERRVGKECRSR